MNEAETRAEHIDSALKTVRAEASASFGHETNFATRKPALLGKEKSLLHQAFAGKLGSYLPLSLHHVKSPLHPQSQEKSK